MQEQGDRRDAAADGARCLHALHGDGANPEPRRRHLHLRSVDRTRRVGLVRPDRRERTSAAWGCHRRSGAGWYGCRSGSITPTGSRTPTSTSSTTSAPSLCRHPDRGASSATPSPICTPSLSISRRPPWEMYVIEGLGRWRGRDPHRRLRHDDQGASRGGRRRLRLGAGDGAARSGPGRRHRRRSTTRGDPSARRRPPSSCGAPGSTTCSSRCTPFVSRAGWRRR